MAIKEILPFNFNDIYSYIAAKFEAKGYDIEEGSNTMQLITAQAYLVSMLNANTAVNINETLLTQARKRTMVLEDARILGYEIEHIQSYSYNFSLNFTVADTYSIKKYDSFTSGDYLYYYMGDEIPEFTLTDITTKHFYSNELTEAETTALAAALVSTYAMDFGTNWSTEFNWTEFSDDLDTTGLVEISEVTPEGDTAGSLNALYWNISSPTLDYYVWYNVNEADEDPEIVDKTGIEVALATGELPGAVANLTNIALDATDGISSSLSAGTIESISIICEAEDAHTTLNNDYFLIHKPSGSYHVWFNVGGSGADPDPGGSTPIPVALTVADTAQTVSNLVTAAINDITGFTASSTTATAESISIICEANVASNLDGLYFLIHQPSGSYHVWFDCTGSTADPEPIGSTGIEVTLTAADTAQEVSDLVVTAVTAEDGFVATNASGTTPTVTIVNDDPGAVTDASAGTTPWATPTINVDGIDLLATIVNDDVGAVTDASAGNTEWAVPTINQQGTARVITITNDTIAEVTSTQDGNTTWTDAWTVTQTGTPFGDVAVQTILDTYSATLKNYLGIVKQVQVSEGILHKYEDNPGTLQQIIVAETSIDSEGTETVTVPYYVDVPYTSIEESGLDVFLTYIDEAGAQHTKEEWVRSSSFMIDSDTELIKQFIRLDSIEYKTPRVYFKLGEVGNTLRVGTLIYINALESSGILGAITTAPEPVSLVCNVIEYPLSSTGAEEEDSESIKNNAPLFHNTANRIITKPDYVAFCNRQTSVKYSDVWDGHYEFPRVPGYIWFSFYPATVSRTLLPLVTTTNASYEMDLLLDRENWFIEDSEITDVWNYLDAFKVPTLIFHHRQPVYFNFNYDIEIIRYSAGSTNKEQHTELFNVVNNYFIGSTSENGVETFKFEYFNSNLTKRIDTALSDITGLNISLTNTLELTEKNINEEHETASEGVFYKEIRAHLGIPYEDTIASDGVITTANLPDITTENFAGTTDTLLTDLSSPNRVEPITGSTQVTTYDILRRVDPEGSPVDTKVGEYKIFDTLDPDIELVFFVEDTAGGGYTEGLDLTEITATLQINVLYPSPNIKFSRNTIPRLKTVNFV